MDRKALGIEVINCKLGNTAYWLGLSVCWLFGVWCKTRSDFLYFLKNREPYLSLVIYLPISNKQFLINYNVTFIVTLRIVIRIEIGFHFPEFLIRPQKKLYISNKHIRRESHLDHSQIHRIYIDLTSKILTKS